MRIAVICEYFYPENSGSTPTDLSELAQFLRHRFFGVEIDVLTSRNLYRTGGSEVRLVPREDWLGVKITRLRTPKSNRSSLVLRLLAGSIFSLAALGRLLLRPRYDLVLIVTNPPANALAAWAYSKLRQVPYVYFVNDLYPDIAVALGRLSRNSLATVVLRMLQRAWLKSAARIVVVGRCMQSHIHRDYGVPMPQIKIIRNWADSMQIRPSAKENSFRSANGLTGFVVLYGGNFSHYVNFDQILGAAKLLSDDREISFVLIGDGARKVEIAVRVGGEGLENVRVLASVPRSAMNEVLAAADVALISLDPRMLGLGVPGKLYSILASGRPVVGMVPFESEVAKILKEEQCGINVPDGDAGALAREISRLHHDRGLVSAMGQNARLALERHFTLERAGEQFHQLFQSVVAK